jgi:hypothetical protein
MTTERNSPESLADGDTDALVTRTYREVADQCVPERLNRAILKEATNAARPRYSRLITWTRPMAWAATVMLSVALVLEVTQAPTPEAVILESGPNIPEVATPQIAPAAIVSADKFKLEDAEMLQRAEGMAEIQSGSNQDVHQAASVAASRSLAVAATAVCSDDAIADPATWLECIESLEKAGLIEAANQQRQLLMSTFPGFELP